MSELNIPEEYERYTDVILDLASRYNELFSTDISAFDGKDVIALLGLLSNTVAELRTVVEDLKNVDDDDRTALFGVLLGIIVEQSVMASDNLSEEQKQQVRDAFATGGMFQTLLNSMRKYYQKILNDMDTNKDKKVTKQEYENYIYKKNKKLCPCSTDEQNRKSAQCSANCCFPILSGGDGIIELDGLSEEDVEVHIDEPVENE